MKEKKKEVTEKVEVPKTETKKKNLKTKTVKEITAPKKKKTADKISSQWEEIISENNDTVSDAKIINSKQENHKPVVVKKHFKPRPVHTKEKTEVKNIPVKDNKIIEKPKRQEVHNDDLTFETQPRFDKDNPKIWNGDKIETFSQPVNKKTFFKKNNKSKFWNKNKPGFQKKRPESQSANKPLVWRENSEGSFNQGYSNQYGQNKQKFFTKKKNTKPFKKKSVSWEERKPRFWNEGKPNSRLNNK